MSKEDCQYLKFWDDRYKRQQDSSNCKFNIATYVNANVYFVHKWSSIECMNNKMKGKDILFILEEASNQESKNPRSTNDVPTKIQEDDG